MHEGEVLMQVRCPCVGSTSTSATIINFQVTVHHVAHHDDSAVVINKSELSYTSATTCEFCNTLHRITHHDDSAVVINKSRLSYASAHVKRNSDVRASSKGHVHHFQ